MAVTDRPERARDRANRLFQHYAALPSYRSMLEREGVEGPGDIAIVGSEAAVEEAIKMPTPELGKLEEVNPGDIWTYGFTSWLADNLDLLGDALGLQLKLVQRSYHIDGIIGHVLEILAEEAKGEKVAIENLFDWTDYSHLGQLVTFAAGCEAKYVVGVSRYFRTEHRTAIDWLNCLAQDKVRFYGVEIRAVKIGDSRPAPDFRVVAAPKDWWHKMQNDQKEKAFSSRHQEFFQALIDDLRQIDITEDSEEERRDYMRCFHSGFENVVYGAGISDEDAHVWCYFDGPAASTRVYALQEPSQGIAGSLTEEWDWNHWDGDKSSEMRTTMVEVRIDDRMEKLDEIRAWMLKNLSELKKVLTPRLEKIQAEMEG